MSHLKTNKVHVWTGLDIALKMAECPNEIVYYELPQDIQPFSITIPMFTLELYLFLNEPLHITDIHIE